jgi:hypothetical protein
MTRGFRFPALEFARWLEAGGAAAQQLARRRAVLLVALVLALVTAAMPLRAQVPEYELKAEFVERFTRFIEWPDEATHAGEPFVIGIFPPGPIAPFLRKLAEQKKIRGRSVEIRELRDPGELAACQVAFLGVGGEKGIEKILDQLRNRPVLTIGDSAGLLGSGVMICFSKAEDRLVFEIDERSATRAGLRISARLLRLARGGGQS